MPGVSGQGGAEGVNIIESQSSERRRAAPSGARALPGARGAAEAPRRLGHGAARGATGRLGWGDGAPHPRRHHEVPRDGHPREPGDITTAVPVTRPGLALGAAPRVPPGYPETLQVHRVRQGFWAKLTPDAASGHPHRREALQVRRLRQELHPELQPPAAPAHPHRRETLRVRGLRQTLRLELQPQPAPPPPQRPEALPVRPVRQVLRRERPSARAPAHPHRREALPLPRLPQDLQPRLPPRSPPPPPRR